MSDHLYDEPGAVNKVYFEQEDKDSIVNIYVSAESLKVYETPWVESSTPNTAGPAEAQHPVILESKGKTNVRCDSVFLGLVCLLLVAGIIYLGVQMNKWRREKIKFLADISNLKIQKDKLEASNTELKNDRDDWLNRFCQLRQNHKKCKKDDLPDDP